MNGPEHYREGERLLAGTDVPADSEQGSGARRDRPSRMDLMEAQTHFLAALAASLASHQHPDSVAWDRVINQ
ncbi:hypothetical protein OG342_04785 [Streptomyces bobili]|uniref:hypothetical protein n=1 Tax=Streptomyces bobili TaxID=67280 RepID=UPI0022569CD4|nr:hypothetical protein [Streptomyces bobili]MCX5522184.1 hypothetical protein [Streptomyces bobili]